MVAIRVHESIHLDITQYHTEYGDIVWMYCPIHADEAIEAVWMLNASCQGSGLVASTTLSFPGRSSLLTTVGQNVTQVRLVVYVFLSRKPHGLVITRQRLNQSYLP